VLEKRRLYRKTVNLSGTYDLIKNGKVVDRGGVKIVDLSLGGGKLKLHVQRNLHVGDHLNLEFSLDDTNQTPVKKKATIRTIIGTTIGVIFSSPDAYDTMLGFYLRG
jgi:hypothetical protein